MWFWWFMLVCSLLTPITMIVVGRRMWKHTPTKINGIYGYRTTRSMQNSDTWQFANAYCGRLWWNTGWILMLPTMLALLPCVHSTPNHIGLLGVLVVTVQLVVLLLTLLPTERALKTHFDNNGNRK